ncbi:MAG TPA: hypothetical protein VK139_07095 [Microbacteriaceae bacterium]|nr:hypothetical protein [Microbacteriaceae bacterium]
MLTVSVMFDPRILEPRDDDEFAEWTREVHRLVRVDTEFPDYPFRNDGFVFAFDRDSIVCRDVLYILEPLIARYGDEFVTIWGLDQGNENFRGSFGYYPAFRVSTKDVANHYDDVFRDPLPSNNGQLPGLRYVTDTLTIVGSSGTWSIWSNWSLETALVHTPDLMLITEPKVWPSIKFTEQTIRDELMPPQPWWQAPEHLLREFFDNLRTHGHLPG